IAERNWQCPLTGVAAGNNTDADLKPFIRGRSVSSEPAAGVATLELRDVAKAFGPVLALRSGSLRVEAGSIHGLVGENGAGKATRVKVVAGGHRRDGGEFLLDGDPTDFGSTAESKAAGIAVIYQEPTLFPDLSVTENIFMGRQPLGRGRRIDRAAMY